MFKQSRTRPSPGRTKQVSSHSTAPEGQHRRPKGGNAQQIFDKYILLAKEALTAGDRVMAESYYQHAEHYLRLVNEQRVHLVEVSHEEP